MIFVVLVPFILNDIYVATPCKDYSYVYVEQQVISMHSVVTTIHTCLGSQYAFSHIPASNCITAVCI